MLGADQIVPTVSKAEPIRQSTEARRRQSLSVPEAKTLLKKVDQPRGAKTLRRLPEAVT